MTASGMALLAPIPSPTVRMEFCGPAIRALILIIVGFFGNLQQHTGLTRVTTKPRALIAGYRLAPVLSATRRPSHSWISPTSAGSSPPQPSSSGGLRRRSEWWRSSRPLRPSFNALSIIVRPRSVHGSGKLCWATTNTTLFRATRLSCVFSAEAFGGCGGVSSSVAVNAPGCAGVVSLQS